VGGPGFGHPARHAQARLVRAPDKVVALAAVLADPVDA